MGVECYDCAICGENGIHEDYVVHCECGASFCDECHEEHIKEFVFQRVVDDEDDELKNVEFNVSKLDEVGELDEIVKCPVCIKKKNNKLLFNTLLEMYNKHRKNKLTKDELKKLCHI